MFFKLIKITNSLKEMRIIKFLQWGDPAHAPLHLSLQRENNKIFIVGGPSPCTFAPISLYRLIYVLRFKIRKKGKFLFGEPASNKNYYKIFLVGGPGPCTFAPFTLRIFDNTFHEVTCGCCPLCTYPVGYHRRHQQENKKVLPQEVRDQLVGYLQLVCYTW